MKKTAYFLLALAWFSLNSCTKDQAFFENPKLDINAVSEEGILSFEKELEVPVRVGRTGDLISMRYGGSFLIEVDKYCYFASAGLFSAATESFERGNSVYLIDGKRYLSVDVPDETGRCVKSILILQLPNGRQIPNQGWIVKDHAEVIEGANGTVLRLIIKGQVLNRNSATGM